MSRSTITDVADRLLEATIVPSFTKIGYSARQRLFDWEPVDADLADQVAVVTGGSSGIGKATAGALVKLGAQVYLTSRKLERAEETAKELNASASGGGQAIGRSLDTGDFVSIKSFASSMAKVDSGIDIFINNAGALSAERKTDDRGVELTLSTHLIGPYLLMNEVRPQFNFGARLLFMSSGGMYTQELDVNRIQLSERTYKGAIAYARAKRGQVEMVTILGPQWAPEVIMHSVHPGWVATAGVDAGLPGFGKVMGPLLRSADQGADTMVWLAATGGQGAKPGQFWHDREPRGTSYVPGTGTTPQERQRLIDWLDEMIADA